jgi:hypothetical protein
MTQIKQHYRQTAQGPVLVKQHEDKRTKHEKPGQPQQRGSGKPSDYPDRKSFVDAHRRRFIRGEGGKIGGVLSEDGKTVWPVKDQKDGKLTKPPESILGDLYDSNVGKSPESGTQAGKRRSSPQSEPAKLRDSLRNKVRRGVRGSGMEVKLTKSEVSTLLKRGQVGFISGGRNPNDPADSKLTDEQIKQRDERLRKELERRGFRFTRVKGKYGDEEESFMVMVPEVKREELIALGTKYKQDSVIFVNKGKNELIYTTGKNEGKHHPGSGFKMVDEEAEDFYTEVGTPEGTMRFSLNFDFGKLKKALMVGWTFLSKARPLQGRMKFQGLDISVENRRGSLRQWYNPHDGSSGMSRKHFPYGYIRGTVGADGEHVDCFVGMCHDAPVAYIIRQRKAPDFTEYDEDKVMLGFPDSAAAKKAYLMHYDDPRFFGSMESMPMEKFKRKVLNGKGRIR